MGRWSLAALVLNSVIGSSVFGLPSVIAGKLGSASPWAWVIAAVGVGVILACFAEVASRFDTAGGPYLYARAAFGRFVGIEMGWLAYLTRLTATATNANLFVIYLAQFWPAAALPWASRLVLALLIGGLTTVNYRGVASGARVSAFFAAAKLGPLLLFVLLGLAFKFSGRGVTPTPHPSDLVAWSDAVLLLVFAYGGFEGALLPLEEAKAPRRDAPFALFAVLGACLLTYTLAQIVVISALAEPAATPRPLADAATVFMGPVGGSLMAVGALISVYGYLAGATLNVPRLTFAMAESGDLPRTLAAVHPTYRTPHHSLLTFALLVWLLASSGSFLQNLTLSAVSRLVTYGLVCGALPRLRRKERQGTIANAEFRLPAGVPLAAVGILFSCALATRTTSREAVFVGVTMLLGLGNWWWVRGSSAAIEPDLPR